jgi:hypothetical protein
VPGVGRGSSRQGPAPAAHFCLHDLRISQGRRLLLLLPLLLLLLLLLLPSPHPPATRDWGPAAGCPACQSRLPAHLQRRVRGMKTLGLKVMVRCG